MSLPIYSHLFNAANQEIATFSHCWGMISSRSEAAQEVMGAVIDTAELIRSGSISPQDVVRIEVEDTGWMERYSFTRNNLEEIGRKTMAARPDWEELHASIRLIFPESANG